MPELEFYKHILSIGASYGIQQYLQYYPTNRDIQFRITYSFPWNGKHTYVKLTTDNIDILQECLIKCLDCADEQIDDIHAIELGIELFISRYTSYKVPVSYYPEKFQHLFAEF